jgi:hypothetical protein
MVNLILRTKNYTFLKWKTNFIENTATYPMLNRVQKGIGCPTDSSTFVLQKAGTKVQC